MGTNMTSETTETAAEAYKRNLQTARDLANRIAIELGSWNANATRLHWGHVGDMAATVQDLQAAAGRMFDEGEHAPEAE